ncbi:hypothetical protein HRbin06_00416 [archaeon HR06]|nr:hypothetical protein HRbin06_00416 [archaeon HR06]
MPTFKLSLSTRDGKAKSIEIKDPQSKVFLGLKIGDVIDGKLIGLEGKIRITGGSDRAGFPMRPDVHGGGKRYLLLTKGIGFRAKEKGERRKKMVRGNTITEEIYQINAVLEKS